MATFTWRAGTSARWGATTDWTLTGGAGTPPPGSKTTATDIATLGPANQAYTVTIATKTYDLETLNIAGKSKVHTTTLNISGSLLTNTLKYGGPRGDAIIAVDNGGLLDIRSSISAKHPETISIAGTGTGGHLEFGSTTSSGLTVNDPSVTFSFSNNTGGTSTGIIEYLSGFTIGAANTTNQSINGLGPGNAIIFDGADFTGDTVSYSGTTLTVTGTDGTKLVMHNISGTSLTDASFDVSGDTITIGPPCYAAGTRILTPTGERPVESLAAGDEILTAIGEALVARPIKWIGRRRIDLTQHPSAEMVAPVRIRCGAFADNAPHRDLLLSPDHAVFIDGKLICARQLINGATIRQETDRNSIEYFHVELNAHAILIAEGLPAESYLDTGNRGFFGNSTEPPVLHPGLTDERDNPTRQAGSCAPFVSDEASVRPVWHRLAERAALLGQSVLRVETTSDPAPWLIVNRQKISPMYGESGLYVFPLPRGTTEVRLMSHAAAPTDVRPWLDDRRRLGLCIERIVVCNAEDLREVPVDSPNLTRGWWAVEREGITLRRWTDGDTVLPLPAIDGPAVLEIRASTAELSYHLEPGQGGKAAV
jgi:hypothetical protein